MASIQNAHNFYFTENTLHKIVTKAGFNIIASEYCKDNEFIFALYEKSRERNVNFEYSYLMIANGDKSNPQIRPIAIAEKFARETKNNKGEKIFTRLSFSIYDNWNECSKFKTKDAAQRKFLKHGGPHRDRFNLDPDGDGFACDWDPEIYR